MIEHSVPRPASPEGRPYRIDAAIENCEATSYMYLGRPSASTPPRSAQRRPSSLPPLPPPAAFSPSPASCASCRSWSSAIRITPCPCGLTTRLASSLPSKQGRTPPPPNKRLSYITRRVRLLQELQALAIVSALHVPGKENPADVLTKSVGREDFRKYMHGQALQYYCTPEYLLTRLRLTQPPYRNSTSTARGIEDKIVSALRRP